MSEEEWAREQLGEFALTSLEVFCRLGVATLHLKVCAECNHPSVHETDWSEDFCPYCSDFRAMSAPAASPPVGPLLVQPAPAQPSSSPPPP